MKYLKLTRYLAVIAGLVMVFGACKKVKVAEPMGDAGTTLIKIIDGGTPAGITPAPIDFVPTPTKILAVQLRRDVPNNTELNKTMIVTVKDDTAAVTAAGHGYLHLPTAWYTLDFDGVKTGGQGGTFTFTFKPGEYAKEIYVIVPNATLLDPSKLYGLGFTIMTADAGGVISAQKSVIVEIEAKNAYDGIYSVEAGNVQRYTAPNVPEVGPLNGSLVGNPDIILATVSANACAIPPVSTLGGLFWAFGSNSMVAGIDGLKVTVDPSTNLVTMTSAANATLSNWAGHTNNYTPGTKVFNLAFRWNPTANVREYEVVLKYKGPR